MEKNLSTESIRIFLDELYMNHIGIRMLIAQHLELLEASLLC